MIEPKSLDLLGDAPRVAGTVQRRVAMRYEQAEEWPSGAGLVLQKRSAHPRPVCFFVEQVQRRRSTESTSVSASGTRRVEPGVDEQHVAAAVMRAQARHPVAQRLVRRRACRIAVDRDPCDRPQGNGGGSPTRRPQASPPLSEPDLHRLLGDDAAASAGSSAMPHQDFVISHQADGLDGVEPIGQRRRRSANTPRVSGPRSLRSPVNTSRRTRRFARPCGFEQRHEAGRSARGCRRWRQSPRRGPPRGAAVNISRVVRIAIQI